MWRKHRKGILVAGLAIGIGLWWLFRPEALFVNRQVSEKASSEVAALQPLFTGSLHAAGSNGPTTGRVNIVKGAGGFLLEISNLESQAAGPFTVALADSSSEAQTQAGSLGAVTAGGHEQLPIPAGLEPDRHRNVLVMDHAHQVIAKAVLEPF